MTKENAQMDRRKHMTHYLICLPSWPHGPLAIELGPSFDRMLPAIFVRNYGHVGIVNE
jgi:hypothetical protein